MSKYYNRQWRLPNNSNKDKVSNYSLIDEFNGGIDLGTSMNITGNLSVSGWFKPRGTTANNSVLVGKHFSTSVSPYFIFIARINSSGGVEWRIGTDTANPQKYYSVNSTTIVRDSNNYEGSWFHFTGTWDGVNIKIYINGALEGTTAAYGNLDATAGLHTSIAALYLSAGSPLSSLNGASDTVAFFNYALSSSQITTLYGDSTNGVGNPMSLNPKPVAYYPLGDQDVFNGSSYLTPNSSLKDYVFSFDGSNDYISASGANLPTGNSSFTASCWFKRNGTQTNYAALLSWGITSPTFPANTRQKVNIIFAPNGTGLRFAFYGDDLPMGDEVATSDNIWYNVVLTYNGSVAKMYINGTLVASHTLGGALNISSSYPLLIGKYSTFEFKGSISNVQIFNTVLPTTGSNSIETLYNNGSPLTSMTGFTSLQGWWKLDASATYDSSTTTWTIPDDSSNSNDGTSSGMTQANLVQSDLSFTNGHSPYALDFDGTNDYINVGSFSLNASAGTVSAWIKTSQSSDFQMIVSKSNGGAGSQLQFRTNADGIFRVILNHSSSVTVIDSATAVNDGNWHNLVFNYSSSGMNLYIDGSLSNSNTTSVTSVDSSTEGFMIGARKISAPEKFFNGSISNVSVWNAALTSAQVSEIYNEGVPSNINNHSAYSNLVSWWQLGSNSSFNSSLNQWTCIDEKGTNTGESSQTFNENAIVDGVGSYANGISSGMSDAILGDAPYSTANALSVNMDVLDRTDDTPS